MTTTMTINDRLVELGVLGNQDNKVIQRAGAEMVEAFFDTHQEGDNVDDATTAQLLHYLTDIQVRDYALGIIDKNNNILSALNYLLDRAPTDTAFINAPASLLAVYLYERGDSASAAVTLTNAEQHYSLGMLLRRVMRQGWPPAAFGKMREELHPKVKAGIFGEEDND
jgi:hypothetical protein